MIVAELHNADVSKERNPLFINLLEGCAYQTCIQSVLCQLYAVVPAQERTSANVVADERSTIQSHESLVTTSVAIKLKLNNNYASCADAIHIHAFSEFAVL